MKIKKRDSYINYVRHLKRLYLTTLFLILPHCIEGDLGTNSINYDDTIKFSQPLNAKDGFHPITRPSIELDEQQNEIFAGKVEYKVLKEKETFTDLRNNKISADIRRVEIMTPTVSILNKLEKSGDNIRKDRIEIIPVTPAVVLLSARKNYTAHSFDVKHNQKNNNNISSSQKDIILKQLEKFLLKYVQDALSSGGYELFSGFKVEPVNGTNPSTAFYRKQNITNSKEENITNTNQKRDIVSFDDLVAEQFRRFADGHVINVNLPRAVETGRLFFFKGLKKILWPVFIGVQIAKTILLALFLPSILGSFTKILGKGITSVSGFNHPSETVSDLDFKDNSYNYEQDNMKYNDYTYQQPQPEASTNHFATQMYDAATMNNNALSRFGLGDQKVTYVNSAADIYLSKNSDANIKSSKTNNFKVFHDIPASSLLLTNYDPFYSPLLSRLDAVFQQLGLGMGNENCREKLICLMYSSPAKYAPYSNLVSAQLSRELNELRKPTSDNPDILRFFKYMKAAKDGQDGISCDEMYKACTSLKDTENPAMLTTYNDINKLVQARKI